MPSFPDAEAAKAFLEFLDALDTEVPRLTRKQASYAEFALRVEAAIEADPGVLAQKSLTFSELCNMVSDRLSELGPSEARTSVSRGAVDSALKAAGLVAGEPNNPDVRATLDRIREVVPLDRKRKEALDVLYRALMEEARGRT